MKKVRVANNMRNKKVIEILKIRINKIIIKLGGEFNL